MAQQEQNDVEVVPRSAARQSARDFAVALANSPQFAAFESAAARLEDDTVAQKAIQAFQDKQQSLQMMIQLNAISQDERVELERLRLAFLAEPSVITYLQAQAELNSICQATAELISQAIGFSYTAACGSSCCG